MSIKGNVSIPLINLAAADNTFLNPSGDVTREAVSTAVLYNTNASNRDIDVYVSPDLTSASGDLIADYTLANGDSVNIDEVIGQAFDQGENIIVVASGAGVNLKGTKIEYTGDS